MPYDNGQLARLSARLSNYGQRILQTRDDRNFGLCGGGDNLARRGPSTGVKSTPSQDGGSYWLQEAALKDTGVNVLSGTM